MRSEDGLGAWYSRSSSLGGHPMNDPFLCFVHIQKNGGSTIHEALRNAFRPYLTVRIFFDANDPRSNLQKKDLAWLLKLLPFTGGVGGHTTRSYLSYEEVVENVFYLTFLRDPIKRYLSHCNYQRKALGIPWNIDSFLAEERFHNVQTVRLAGRPDLEAAKKEARERFGFVGILERFDESLVLLADRTARVPEDLCYEKKNVLDDAPDLFRFGDLPRRTRSQIEHANGLDLELYEFAQRELFPRYRESYGGDLERDIDTFRAKNADFSPVAARSLALDAYQKLFRLVVEPCIYLHRPTPDRPRQLIKLRDGSQRVRWRNLGGW